jgi:Xaa-Pro aminopeptidase
LHYIQNDAELREGDLVLVDAGAEYQYYAADITRTFPVGKHFTTEQAAIYEWVLKAQMAAIEMIRPGILWGQIQESVVTILSEGLSELGILKDHTYKQFYMHNSGHWLGLDVHDVGSYKIGEQGRPLEAGMVLTVEPGIYIAPDD